MPPAKSIRLVSLSAILLASFSGAQTVRTLEVASVKPSSSKNADSNLDSTPGRLTATNITVMELIRLAYTVKDYQLGRAPGWLDSERYDIAAKVSGGNSKNLEEERAVVRELLAGRFQLATHRETKEVGVYFLVVAKSGSKLTPHNDGVGSGSRRSCGHLAGTRLTADTIATILSRLLEREVLNRTDLPGKFDFKLDWTPDSGPCPSAGDGDAGAAAGNPPSLPSFNAAVQQQLGLRLESGKGPMEVLMIDHVERPSGN
jgi:uncharacterized protein (TIGR03435 family)